MPLAPQVFPIETHYLPAIRILWRVLNRIIWPKFFADGHHLKTLTLQRVMYSCVLFIALESCCSCGECFRLRYYAVVSKALNIIDPASQFSIGGPQKLFSTDIIGETFNSKTFQTVIIGHAFASQTFTSIPSAIPLSYHSSDFGMHFVVCSYNFHHSLTVPVENAST